MSEMPRTRLCGSRLMPRRSQSFEFKAKIVSCAASTSTRRGSLMNSATEIWPSCLAASSGELWSQRVDHHFALARPATSRLCRTNMFLWRRPTVFISSLRNLYEDRRDYLRGFGYQAEQAERAGPLGRGTVWSGAGLTSALTDRDGLSADQRFVNPALPRNRLYLDPNKPKTMGPCRPSPLTVSSMITAKMRQD